MHLEITAEIGKTSFYKYTFQFFIFLLQMLLIFATNKGKLCSLLKVKLDFSMMHTERIRIHAAKFMQIHVDLDPLPVENDSVAAWY